MANQEHLDILKQGKDIWKDWRRKRPKIQPDLSKANLSNANLNGIALSKANLFGANLSRAALEHAYLIRTNLSKADLTWTDLRRANLSEANLSGADLSHANLIGANLIKVNLIGASLSGANLSGARFGEARFIQANLSDANLSGGDFSGSDFSKANLTRANLNGANLSRAILVGTNLAETILTNCLVYGISAWDMQLQGAIQFNLVITLPDQPTITVDNLEVAQFIYLLLNNQKIRDVIDTITSKVVLILGRFIPERKVILDALRDELRKRNYSPVVFDFEKPASRDLTETVSTLAHMARFIIVDLTDPSSAPHEVATIIPQCIVPVQPLVLQDETQPRHEYAMFHDLRARYHWVLPTYHYLDTASLLASLEERVIAPAEQKAEELAMR